jgi:hypothetical protein
MRMFTDKEASACWDEIECVALRRNSRMMVRVEYNLSVNWLRESREAGWGLVGTTREPKQSSSAGMKVEEYKLLVINSITRILWGIAITKTSHGAGWHGHYPVFWSEAVLTASKINLKCCHEFKFLTRELRVDNFVVAFHTRQMELAVVLARRIKSFSRCEHYL